MEKRLEVLIGGRVVDEIPFSQKHAYSKFPMTNKIFREKIKVKKEEVKKVNAKKLINVYKNNKAKDFVGGWTMEVLVKRGYDEESVLLCLSGKQKTHKRMIFSF